MSPLKIAVLFLALAATNESQADPVRSMHDGSGSSADFAAAIDRNFPAIIEQNIAAMDPAQANAWLDRMSDTEFDHLAQLYTDSNARHARAGTLQQLLAERLDTARLARTVRIFWREEARAARPDVSPLEFQADGFTPGVNMTFTQLYQGFRSMKVGSMGETAAFFETLMYAGKEVMVAYGPHYDVGTPLAKVMETYMPDFYRNKFLPGSGGSTSKVKARIQDSAGNVHGKRTSPIPLGEYLSRLLPAYAIVPTAVDSFGQDGGDLGMVREYAVYIDTGFGGCTGCDDRDPL